MGNSKYRIILFFATLFLLCMTNFKTTANAVETIKKTTNDTILGFNYALPGSKQVGVMLPETLSSNTVMIKVKVGDQVAYLRYRNSDYRKYDTYKNGITGILKVEYDKKVGCPYKKVEYTIDESMLNKDGFLDSKYEDEYLKQYCDSPQSYSHNTFFPVDYLGEDYWKLNKDDRAMFGKGNYYILSFYNEFKVNEKITVTIEKEKDDQLETTTLLTSTVRPEVNMTKTTVRKTTINVEAQSIKILKATYDNKSVKVKKVSGTKYAIPVKKPQLNKKLKITILYKDGLKETIEEKTSNPIENLSHYTTYSTDEYIEVKAKNTKTTDKVKVKVGKKYYSANFSKKGKAKVNLPNKVAAGKSYTFYIQDKYGNNLEKGRFFYYKYSKAKIGMSKSAVKGTLFYYILGKPDEIAKYTSKKRTYEDWYYYRGNKSSKYYHITFVNGKVHSIYEK